MFTVDTSNTCTGQCMGSCRLALGSLRISSFAGRGPLVLEARFRVLCSLLQKFFLLGFLCPISILKCIYEVVKPVLRMGSLGYAFSISGNPKLTPSQLMSISDWSFVQFELNL